MLRALSKYFVNLFELPTKRWVNVIEGEVQEIKTNFSQTDAKLDSITSKLSNLAAQNVDIVSQLSNLNAQNVDIVSQLSSLKSQNVDIMSQLSNLKSQNVKIVSRLDRHDRNLGQFRSSMGDGLEKMSARWLETVLVERGIQGPFIEVGKVFSDPDGFVHSLTKQVEVDIFCSNPPTIGECTAFLKKTEFHKLQNFQKVKRFFESSQGRKFEAYFVTFGISEEIAEKSYQFMRENDIKFVDAGMEL